MRAETRARLRQIIGPTFTPEIGVTGVTEAVIGPDHPLPHRLSHPGYGAETLAQQGVTPVTLVTRRKLKVKGERHTPGEVTARWQSGVAASDVPSDWLDHFEERAAIREFEGGFDRPEAERLAWTETIDALGEPVAQIERAQA